jgi:tetratricopeptide (TPR) repeat protein
MPAANLGPASPLVPLWYDTAELAIPRTPINLDEEDVKYYGYGYHHGCLPYFVQDSYDRARTPRGFKAALLENENLRATFLLGLGGRLWSLFDKRTNRELLHVNPVFQPANLALRNAWISGGVEWNFCWMGHTPFTCDAVFAGRTELDDGTPVLRMWEYERVRQMAFQIDAWLPGGSTVLYVRVRLANLDNRTVPIYWWSNIAVPERKDIRVMVPAVASHQWAPKALERHSYPIHGGRDHSYPTNAPHSGDRFFRIEPPQYPWIASVGGDGNGFFQSSTRRLIGRKLWVFGQNAGGRRWQDFLNTPGHPYVEIQAGLARTQGECLPLPPKTEWEWLEAYGAIDNTDPKVVHGSDWNAAWQETQRVVNNNVTIDQLDELLAASRGMAERPPQEFIQKTSGWGALENHRRARAGQNPCAPASTPFPDDTMGPEQAPWLELLEKGTFPETAPNVPPVSWMIQDEWREMLERAVGITHSTVAPGAQHAPATAQEHGTRKSGVGVAPSDHWLAWLHLGVMYLGGQWDFDKARAAWEKSLAHKPNAWAYRMLAALATHEKKPAEAAALYPKAVALAPDNQRLVVECGRSLVGAGKAREWLDIVDRLPASVRSHGHVKVYEALAAVEVDDLDRAGRVLHEPFELVEVREGETTSVQAWFAYQEKRIAKAEGIPVDEALKERVRKECPPPKHLDFRL